MQDIIIEKPYEFIPPHRGTFLPRLIRDLRLFKYYLRKAEGVVDCEIRNLERFTQSLAAGHGILLTPNHSRTADSIVMGWLAYEARCLVYAMASWHLFHAGWFERWAMRVMGGFSVYREGIDRKAINLAIEILETAERPRIIFPEGTTSRTNDRLMALLEGVGFIARTAAKRRARQSPPGKVVVHPVALKYFFGGDLKAAVDPVLTEIERRLSWQIQSDVPLMQRIAKVGRALLSLKELEYFGATQSGSMGQRLQGLVNRLLDPLEKEWLGRQQEGGVVPRIKALRMKLLPEMIEGKISQAERKRRWKQFADLYLAQQVSCYPPDYLAERSSVDRLLETVERFEEDLTDKARVHGHLKVVMQIGEAIEVSPRRDRKAESDPLMTRIEQELQSMLDQLALESPIYEEKLDGSDS